MLADVPEDADIFWEETFGPVLTVAPVADLESALDLSNRSRYGLDSAVFTSNLEAAWRAARALEVGHVTINDAPGGFGILHRRVHRPQDRGHAGLTSPPARTGHEA